MRSLAVSGYITPIYDPKLSGTVQYGFKYELSQIESDILLVYHRWTHQLGIFGTAEGIILRHQCLAHSLSKIHA